jgi:hypothetical protein
VAPLTKVSPSGNSTVPRISTVTTPLLELLEELELLELLEELELELELLELLEELELLELFDELELLVELELAPGFSCSLPEFPPPFEQAPSNNMKISINIWLIKSKDDLETLIVKTLP